MTVIEMIEAGEHQLAAAGVVFGHGTSNAFDEAAWLVLWQLGLPLDQLDTVAVNPVSPENQGKVSALLQSRILTRKPAAYLTHEAWLQGVSFYVDERCIVPRSFIAELLVNGSLDPWLNSETHEVLDLCTGNASLAILAALAYPDVTIRAADISSDALAVARINVQRHQLEHRITLIQSDGLAALQEHYDLILCNPPYVNADSMASLPPEYQAEPALALDGNSAGNPDGMDFIRQLLPHAAQYLSTQGIVVLEIGHEREHFEAAFPGLETVWLATSAGDDQVLLLTRESLIHWGLGRASLPHVPHL